MRSFLRIAVLIGAALVSVTAEAKEYSYAQRDQFCMDLFKAMFAAEDKVIENLIRDNTRTMPERVDTVVTQAVAFAKVLKDGLKGGTVKRMALAESKDFTLLNQRYYLIDAGEPLFLGYCLVRDMDNKVHFAQFSLTSQETEFSKFFARGW